MRIFLGTSGGLPFASLSENGKVLSVESGGEKADYLLLIEQALGRARRSLDDVGEIAVDRGPGGFSAVRRRLAAAASLAAALDVPLAGSSGLAPEEAAELPSSSFVRGAPVEPLYDKAPNITVKSISKKHDRRRK